MQAKVGPLLAQDGSRRGITDFYAKMAGKPFAVGVTNDKGGLDEAISYGGHDWSYVFRVTGPRYDAPDYNADPVQEASEYWASLVGATVGVPDHVWLCVGNELDKNRPGWLGKFGLAVAELAAASDLRVVLFNFAAGEPEVSFWRDPDVARLLAFAGGHREHVAIGLHEYSYETKDDASVDPPIPAILRGFPWMVGRYRYLFDVCDDLAIPRTNVFITEHGWKHNAIPSQERAIRDIKLSTERYQDERVLGAVLWYSGGGEAWDGICFDVEKLFPDWGDYNASLVPDAEPPVVPPVTPPAPDPDEIDLKAFLIGKVGVQHVLQCDFGDHFQGTQTLCTLDHGLGVFSQQKDREREIIYFDDFCVYRDVDTSPGDHDGRKAFYHMSDVPAGRGAYWCDRFVSIGDQFVRTPYVWHRYFDNCGVFASGQPASTLRVAALHTSFNGYGGFLFNRPTVELHWIVGGVLVERYFYGQGRGLVGWEEVTRHWRSGICEEHFSRPPMDSPEWPSCMPVPWNVELYHRGPTYSPPPPPEPEDDPRDYHRIFHLLDESIDPLSDEARQVWKKAAGMRSTCGYSWHDAVVDNPHLLSRTVYMWDMPLAKRAELISFQMRLFPGVVRFLTRYTENL